MNNLKSLINLYIKFIFIRIIDLFAKKKGEVLSKGFYIYKNKLQKANLKKDAKELYEDIANCDKFINHSENIKSADLYNFNDILNLKPSLVQIIDEEIISHIKNYFGKNIKLDHAYLGIYFTKSSGNSEINAGLYHHDSVGHRCKLFVPINPTGTLKSPTVYIKGSNKNLWGFDIFNLNYKKGFRLDDLVKNHFKGCESEIKASFGDAYVFDTNGIHRGSYDSSNELRCIMQLEFSRYKSILKGDVGPGTFHMDEKSYFYLKNLNLLREERIKKIDNTYVHRGLYHKEEFKKLSDYLN